MKKLLVLLLFSFFLFACERNTSRSEYYTRNIIVVVADGARYSETWGDSSHANIPNMANVLSKQGVIYTKFFNNGPTYTLSGHTSMTTGNYQEINNSGAELPENPSVFQELNNTFGYDSTMTWIISSKDKLEVLSDCNKADFSGRFRPSRNCGISGNGSGYRHDSVTLKTAFSVLSSYHPRLTLISFREPDYSGHTGVFSDYLNGVKLTDDYILRIWEFIQNDEIYRNTTALFVLNDHGRHLDGVDAGFSSHGDTCSGCRHIIFYAFGPDFKKGLLINSPAEIIDLPSTISYILKFPMTEAKGKVLYDLFK